MFTFNDEHRERFRQQVEVDDNDCWIWKGRTTTQGYGRYRYYERRRGKTEIPAHRAAYLMFAGDVPAGTLVLHRCDHRLCVNPDHLYLGTTQDNNRDMEERTRSQYPELWKRSLGSPVYDGIQASTGPYAAIASRYGVSIATVARVKAMKMPAKPKPWNFREVPSPAHFEYPARTEAVTIGTLTYMPPAQFERVMEAVRRARGIVFT